MGILKSTKTSDKPIATTAKRRSMQPDFANLKPLKAGGTMGFTNFREVSDPREKSSSKQGGSDAMESDDDEDVDIDSIVKLAEPEGEDFKNGLLSPEDAKRQGELAEGVKKIKVCTLSPPPFPQYISPFPKINHSPSSNASTLSIHPLSPLEPLPPALRLPTALLHPLPIPLLRFCQAQPMTPLPRISLPTRRGRSGVVRNCLMRVLWEVR